jgi:hypothetical protein
VLVVALTLMPPDSRPDEDCAAAATGDVSTLVIADDRQQLLAPALLSPPQIRFDTAQWRVG